MAYTLDPFNGSLIGGLYSPPVPGKLEGIAYDPVTSSIMVGDADGGPIYQLNASSGYAVRAVGTGSNPYGVNNDPSVLFYDRPTNTLYVAITTTGIVRFFNATTGQPLGSVTEGYSASGFAYDTASGVLYITNFGANNVTLLNTSDNRMLATNITVCNEATSEVWAPSNGELFVTCVDTEEVLVVNTTQEKVVKHLLIGGSSGANVYPSALAYDPTNEYVYVANQQASNVSIINSTTNSFVGSGISTHGYSPESILYDPASGGVLVGTLPDGLDVINAANNTLESERIATGDDPASLGYDFHDGLIYAVNEGDNTLTQLSAATGTVSLPNITLVHQAIGATYDPTNREIYVPYPDENFACLSPGSLLAVHTALTLPQAAAVIPVGLGPESPIIDLASNRAFVPNFCSNTLSVVNGTSDSVTTNSYRVGAGPIAGANDPRSGTVFVANGNSDNLTSVNASTLAPLLTNATAGAHPDAVAFDPMTDVVYVANFGSDNVSRLNGSTGAAVGPGVAVGSEPDATLYDQDNNRVYVANFGSNNVTVLNATSGVSLGSIGLGAGGPIAMDIDLVTNSIFIADLTSGAVSVLNATSGSLDGSPIRVGSEPEGLAFDPLNRALFVADWDSGAIVILTSGPTDVSLLPSENPTEVGHPLTLIAEVGSGPAPYSYSYSGLPSGCETANSSWISCIPKSAGTFEIGVWVNDSVGGYPGFTQVTLTVAAAPQILSASAAPPLIELGAVTTFEVDATGGVGALTIGYTNLPSGCTSSNTPSLTCRPDQIGVSATLVNVSDALGARYSATIWLEVVPALKIAALYAAPNPVALGSNLTLVAIADGGIAPYVFAYSGLPPGCTTRNATELACLPTQTGNFTVEVELTDADGRGAYANASITVVTVPPPPLRILAFLANPSSIALGTTTTLEVFVDGGEGPVDFAYSGLPSGCASASTASLTCAPMGAGQFAIRVTVTDALGNSVGGSTALVVLAASTIKNVTVSQNPGVPWFDLVGVAATGLLVGGAVVWAITRSRANRPAPEADETGPKGPAH